MWMVDRSRYIAGFTCPWRRLLQYHANLEPLTTASALVTGIATHRSLELLLQPHLKSAASTPLLFTPQGRAALAASQALQEQPPAIWESASDPSLQKDLVTGLTHGYARITLPWLLEHFEILATEEEQLLLLDHPQMPLTWMSRPDLICRHKQTGILSIHDFKTASYWKDSNLNEWADNVQMMMNAHVCSQALGEPVPNYYIHILVKGNDEYPSPLVSAWFREPMPPFQTEDWQTKRPGGRDMKYRKVRVSEHRAIEDWAWTMPLEDCMKGFIIGGPFLVQPSKVHQFIDGLHANEWWWQQSIDTVGGAVDPASQMPALNRTFPRTFQCYTYGSRCPYYRVCFTPDWQSHYKPRTPHHTTEEI